MIVDFDFVRERQIAWAELFIGGGEFVLDFCVERAKLQIAISPEADAEKYMVPVANFSVDGFLKTPWEDKVLEGLALRLE